jgi:hypothetical protein
MSHASRASPTARVDHWGENADEHQEKQPHRRRVRVDLWPSHVVTK